MPTRPSNVGLLASCGLRGACRRLAGGWLLLFSLGGANVSEGWANEPANPAAGSAVSNGLVFIDTSIENGSPLWYTTTSEGIVELHLLYDRERSSPNRAAGHFHFLISAAPGSKLTLEFKNLDNIWNGTPGSVANELRSLVVSDDGQRWRPIATRSPSPGRVLVDLETPQAKLYVARVEPYRISDLERLLGELETAPETSIEPIGETVQGRRLELIHIGQATAPWRVFLRARAHPWEAGGNWVVEGLVRRLIQDEPLANEWRRRFRVSILPMANKDGVALGRTRFNLLGKDLNREWDRPADKELAPENAALEAWLERSIAAGQRPHLALELHNDGNGKLHVSRPAVAPPGEPQPPSRHEERMAILEALLREHTWFSEGSTPPGFRNRGTLGDGWLERFGIDAVVHEFNCQWIARLDTPPTAEHWREYGAALPKVFDAYFETTKPDSP